MADNIKYCLGIDIGGMTVKGVVLDVYGNALVEDNIATNSENGGDAMCDNIASLVNGLLARIGADKSQVKAGAGCPGIIDSVNGVIVFAGNLNLKNYPLAAKLKERTGLDILLTNDANAAALGEAKFGAGREYSDSILITLGTGLGGGIIIGGKLFEGNKSAGAEIGHMVIERRGNLCTCGRRGCFETYCSATALIKRTRYQMEENPGSAMWTKYTSETATGKTAFEFADTDLDAKEVVEWYLKHLSCGIANLVNIFRPQVVMIGGGVSGEKEKLTEPLQRLVDKEIFGGTDYAPVKIVTASLGSKAGAYGAAALAMEKYL
ncbi:MAG: ROK family protein [Clostridia bacterium]|nr:ROK family protein [Clostridia bacterium]